MVTHLAEITGMSIRTVQRNPVYSLGLLGWGVGVIIHGLVAFEIIGWLSVKWEKTLIEKRLGRKL